MRRARRPGPPSRPRRARCARRRAPSAAPARPRRRGRPATPRTPRRLGRRSRRPARSRRAARPMAMAAARNDLAPCGTATRPTCRPTRPMSAGVPRRSLSGGERAGRGEERRQAAQVRESVARPGPGVGGRRSWRPGSLRARCRFRPSGVLDLRVDRADVEIDGLVVARWPMTCREVLGDLLGDAPVAPAPAAQGRGRRFRHRPSRRRAGAPAANRSSCDGSRCHRAAHRPRRARRVGRRRLRAAGTC